jgi:hypothetical protein
MSDDNDSFTETTTQGWGSRLGGSLIAALLGLVLFVASFALLYWNEGRAVDAIRALDQGAGLVVAVSADRVDPALQTRLIHVSAKLAAAGSLLDPTFHVGGDGLVRLRRTVEMYQWKEHSETTTHKNLGGSETKETTYKYEKLWSDTAINSSAFKRQDGHVNPAMTMKSQIFDAPTVKLGAFRLDQKLVDKLEGFSPLAPEPAAGSALPRDYRWDGDSLYRGASAETPTIGDLRVSFAAVAAQPISAVGEQFNDTLAPYVASNGHVIALVEPGTVPPAAMFREAEHQEAIVTWVLRAVGFVMMLIGLWLTSSPLSTVLGVLPFLEGVAEAGGFVIALLLAVPLTLLTIAIAWIVHRPLIGAALLIGGALATYALRRLLPARKARIVAAGRPA